METYFILASRYCSFLGLDEYGATALPMCKVLMPIIDGSIRSGMVPHKRGGINRFFMKFVDKVISNSQAGLDAFRIQPPKGMVIYNGFDFDRLELSKTPPKVKWDAYL